MRILGKSLSNVIHLRAENERGYREHSKIMYVENLLMEDGTVRKNFEIEETPEYTFYSTHHLHTGETRQEKSERKGVNYVRKEDCRAITVPYDDIYYEMAKVSNQMRFYQECVSNNNRRSLWAIEKDIDLHLTDMPLADYKIRQWLDANRDQMRHIPLAKSFYDIEVDIYGYEGFPEPEEAPRPVALLSYIYEPTMTLHSFILRNPKNQSQTEFLLAFEEHRQEYIALLLEEFNAPGEGDEKLQYKELMDIRFHIYDEEEELIAGFFKLVKRDKPDFCGAWNASFDMLTLQNRLLKKKRNPVQVMCHQDFPYRQVNIRPDTFNTDFSKKKSMFEVTGYTQFICMLENFAAIRATMGKRESYALGAILLEEIGESKFEYEGDIQDAMYVDFEGFLKYSMYDSFRLFQLESKNRDIDLLYNMGLMTATRFSKVMTKTTSIRNFAAMLLEKDGYILSNNHNKQIDHGEKKKFRGAFVALPNMMEPVGIEINDGIRSIRVYENVVDEDLAALYPNLILSFNIDADTMIGKIFCDERPELDDAIPTMISENDPVDLGKQLLGLPSVDDILSDLEHYIA